MVLGKKSVMDRADWIPILLIMLFVCGCLCHSLCVCSVYCLELASERASIWYVCAWTGPSLWILGLIILIINRLALFISYKSWQKCGTGLPALTDWLILLCFDARLADASGSAASRFLSICFIRFRMRCNYKQRQISGRSPSFWQSAPYSNGMSQCSRWPVGDRGPLRPRGPIHSVTPPPPTSPPPSNAPVREPTFVCVWLQVCLCISMWETWDQRL